MRYWKQHFFSSDSFVYKAQQADNIMVYSHQGYDHVDDVSTTVIDKISNGYWQWQIINNL
ncbi:hypothetical protein HNQ02_001490 [Flavobacterium sp. 7E]|uniref:hypothetical protein n=1 Tax=Flavobacterium sp. 7E TaxID=2735898 RepID=UPI00156EC1A5|nr:hypothetical protein [Flavobacterium sp. 7E]NRS88576.1 hypothetical protein [Flavobacterium sp. 7E]